MEDKELPLNIPTGQDVIADVPQVQVAEQNSQESTIPVPETQAHR